ncbi:hypothetical protein [Peribacillus phoenicis]|uniref:hypothetical protein n=1 Tax=Peribacillus sp. 1P06PA-2 TaxID=3132295 RepID=UPI0039A6884E
MKQILVNSNITQDFELFSYEIGTNIRELESLLVNYCHLLVNSDQILVRFIHLLVNLKQILVNSDVTQDFELLPHEFRSNTREIHPFTREYGANTREIDAFTREFEANTREFGYYA